ASFVVHTDAISGSTTSIRASAASTRSSLVVTPRILPDPPTARGEWEGSRCAAGAGRRTLPGMTEGESPTAGTPGAGDENRTESGLPFESLYGPDSLKNFEPAERLGKPGEYPFTRGVYPS